MSIEDYPSELVVTNAIIANGATASSAVDLYGTSLLALDMPSTFEGTTITIQASSTKGGTYKTVYNAADLSIAVAASKYVILDNLQQIIGLRYIKLVSNNAVGADRTIGVISKRL